MGGYTQVTRYTFSIRSKIYFHKLLNCSIKTILNPKLNADRTNSNETIRFTFHDLFDQLKNEN